MSDFAQQQHEMFLDRTYPSGAEEWYCPACGRRFVMQWPPKYKRIILNGGDDYAAHSGGTGGLKMGSAQIAHAEERGEDLHLDRWEEWFGDVNFD
jgi:hypothetical protein